MHFKKIQYTSKPTVTELNVCAIICEKYSLFVKLQRLLDNAYSRSHLLVLGIHLFKLRPFPIQFENEVKASFVNRKNMFTTMFFNSTYFAK